MDINIMQTHPTRCSLFSRGDGIPTDAAAEHRKPGVYIAGNDVGSAVNHIQFWHGASMGITSTAAATLGTYFKLVFVVNDKKIDVYIDGIFDSTVTAATSATWTSTGFTNKWSWGSSTAGAINVKNMYFWNKALTATEIYSLGPNIATTTSTYMPEPYSMTNNTKEL